MGRKRNVDKTAQPEDPEALRYAVGYGDRGTVLVKFNRMLGSDLALDHESARLLGQNLIRAARAAQAYVTGGAPQMEPGAEEIVRELTTETRRD